MKKLALIILIFITFSSTFYAQKVGLVLSGGGAKGIAHIGMIKALEENNIPIDYITGTSIGAIVGSLYAIGYSPEEMMELIKSPDFQLWMKGEVEEKYIYYFNKEEPNPSFINFRMNLNDIHSINKRFYLPTNLLNPRQMNIAFSQLFGPANAASDYNFDHLMVPFRCVSSDINNRVPIISRNGDLGDAVRASMSFPFAFKPIKINGVLAYDGGIYDNFPVGVMMQDFNPDYIIGSKVAAGRTIANERDIITQIENMIMDETDYSVPKGKGILISFNMEDVKLLDFNKADSIYKLGYNKTIALIDSIKSDIPRESFPEDVAAHRAQFKEKLPPLILKKVHLENVSDRQKAYIQNFFPNEGKTFTYEDLKSIYFRMLTDTKISEIMPHVVYNNSDSTFDLHMNIKMDDKITFSIGGLISFQNYNEMYLGASYQRLGKFSQSYLLDAQLGKSYNSIAFRARTDIPDLSVPISLNFIAALNSQRYYDGEKFFDQRESTAFISLKDYYFKFKFATPFLNKGKIEFGAGWGYTNDRYYQPTTEALDNRYFDESSYNFGIGFARIERNTLNDKQYPTRGNKKSILAQIVWGKERFYKSTISQSDYSKNHAFLQMELNHEEYSHWSEHFVMGTLLNAVVSARNFMNNYTSSIIEAPAFTPTPHSKMVFNEAFRAYQYAAAGVIPIWRISDIFHVRSEVYAFLPYKEILSNKENHAFYGEELRKIKWMGETSVIFHLPQISIGAYLNYYNSPISSWNIGINIGYLLFTPRLIE